MEGNSLWLGGLRQPIKQAMIGCTALTAILYVWLVGNRIFVEGAIGMHQMIRPAEGGPLVTVMLTLIALTLLFTSLFLSDTRGAIEQEPDGFFDILSLVCSRLAMISIALIVIVMFYEVVSRYVFSRPTLWANELSLWIAAFLFLFAGQYAMQQRSHIRIYVIYDMMPRWAQKTSDVISVVLICAFTFALIWGGYNDAMRRMLRMETFGTAWDPAIPGTVKPAILIIIILVTIQAISNLIADWNKAPEHHNPADEIDETEIENIRKTLEEDKR
ncbi:TRAP transporter small permease subunit [Pacificoceanicola onchidii]|uniref:TRAP transporter small permease subunit n=1 Tax=Pacificoceanicola onchidii TaxID=2562685 RepID=UPI0010A436CC|nr:TRAP transporter small permease [Pacificoceanicola onchidii]